MKGISFTLLLVAALTSAHAAAPNFIVILGEGAGWTSSSVQMDDRLPASRGTGPRTPNLERLAAAGMRFSAGYAASPRCTPSRAALFTGRSPAALHMTFIGDGRGGTDATFARVIAPHALLELPESESTIAEVLHRANYATAHFGKWHVGRVDPTRHGFDESDGANGNGGPDNVANPNPTQARELTARGIAFMERQATARRPFYLQMSHYPNQAEKGGSGNPTPEKRESDVQIVDETIGEVLDTLGRLGLMGNTYILYTTDHGTPGRNAPLAGGKGTVLDGGLRVPFIIAGPGVKAGACSHVRVSAMDILPTFAELAGVQGPLPGGVEGGSFASLLKNGGTGTVKRSREEFVVHFPHYDKDAQGPASALLLGDYKLIRVYATGERQLFDLVQDLSEHHNLAQQLPAKVIELDQRLSNYLTAVNAQLPMLNEEAATDQRPPETRGGQRKPGARRRNVP